LFIGCSGGLELPHDLLIRHRGHLAAIGLSPWLHDTIHVTAGGRISQMPNPDLANVVPDFLFVLSRSAAYDLLVRLPTVRKPASPEVGSIPRPDTSRGLPPHARGG
jgi:hypothetical protein